VKHRKDLLRDDKQWEKHPFPSYIMQQRIHGIIRYTLQMFAAVLIGMEVAIPPNPYKMHLIIVLSILIAHKYHIVSKLINTLEKWSGKKS